MGKTEAFYDTEKEASKAIKDWQQNSIRVIQKIVLSELLVNATDGSEVVLFRDVVFGS